MLIVYRPRQVAGHRYLGDKRSGVVYDLDDVRLGGDVNDVNGVSSEGDVRSRGEVNDVRLGGEVRSRGGVGDMNSGEGSTPRSLIDELLASELYICFAPDTLPEARNRGYRLYRRRAFREALRRVLRLGRHTRSVGNADRSLASADRSSASADRSSASADRSLVGNADRSAFSADRSSASADRSSANADRSSASADRSSVGSADRSALNSPVR